jgi:hypothetical protein
MASFPRSLGSSSQSSNLVTIVKQSSPFEERVTRNGIQRDIHVVIKNSPFAVQIAVSRNCEIDLNHIAFEASLLYDTDGEKGVDFVKLKPIEYKCIPNEAGDQVSVELRIKVLTSQHEDMFFKVKIQGQDPVSKQEIPNLKVITSPIKVISKPEQLKKRQPGAPAMAPPIITQQQGITPTLVAPVPNPNITVTNPNSKKRTVNDLVIEAITRIEKQQSEQANSLDRIMQFIAIPKQEGSLNPNTSWEFLPPLAKSQRKEDSFESHFGALLKSFQSLDPNSRAEKVRRVARGLSLAENEALAEFVDMMMTEGLGIDCHPSRLESRPVMPNNLMPQHLDIKPALYCPPQQHPSHPHQNMMHASQHHMQHNLALGMSKDGGDMRSGEGFFFASMLQPNYPVNVSVGNGEEAYPDFLTASPTTTLPLGNSADFLNM